MVEAGKKYKTVGGWEVLVVYVNATNTLFFAVHAPGTPNETMPIPHQMNGMMVQHIAIPPIPRFDKLFPADVLVNEVIQ